MNLNEITPKNRTIVIVMTFILLFVFLGGIFFVTPPDGARDILLFGSGVLFGSVEKIVSFFFPSSPGEDD